MSNASEISVKALNLDKNGDWEGAHMLVQPLEHPFAYWVHAYLHRKEGDVSNASYWYNRAEKEIPKSNLKEEWTMIYESITAVGV